MRSFLGSNSGNQNVGGSRPSISLPLSVDWLLRQAEQSLHRLYSEDKTSLLLDVLLSEWRVPELLSAIQHQHFSVSICPAGFAMWPQLVPPVRFCGDPFPHAYFQGPVWVQHWGDVLYRNGFYNDCETLAMLLEQTSARAGEKCALIDVGANIGISPSYD